MKIESNERLAKAIRINLLDFKKKIIFPAILGYRTKSVSDKPSFSQFNLKKSH